MSDHAQPQLPNVTQMPNRIDLDLDSYHDDKDPGPFHFQVGGQAFEMTSPAQLDFTALLDMESELDILEIALGEEQFKRLRALRLPVAKATKLAQAYQQHAQYMQDPGEGDGSP